MSKKKEALVKRVVKLCENQENFEQAELSNSLRALNIPELQRQLKQLHWQQVTSSAFKRLPLRAARSDSILQDEAIRLIGRPEQHGTKDPEKACTPNVAVHTSVCHEAISPEAVSPEASDCGDILRSHSGDARKRGSKSAPNATRKRPAAHEGDKVAVHQMLPMDVVSPTGRPSSGWCVRAWATLPDKNSATWSRILHQLLLREFRVAPEARLQLNDRLGHIQARSDKAPVRSSSGLSSSVSRSESLTSESLIPGPPAIRPTNLIAPNDPLTQMLLCDEILDDDLVFAMPAPRASGLVANVPPQLNEGFVRKVPPGEAPHRSCPHLSYSARSMEAHDHNATNVAVAVKRRKYTRGGRERDEEFRPYTSSGLPSDRLLATRPAEHVNMSSIAPANLAGSCIATEPPQSTAILVDFDPLSTLEAIHSCLERDSLIEDDETFEVAQGSFELLQPAFQFSELTLSLFETAYYELDLSLPVPATLSPDDDADLVTAIECPDSATAELSIPTALPLAPSPSPLLPMTHSHSGYLLQGELGCIVAHTHCYAALIVHPTASFQLTV